MSRKKIVHITREASFEAAHQLVGYSGNCARIHGHSYKLQVTVSGSIPCEITEETPLPTDYMVLDFKVLDSIIKSTIVEKYDHQDLNNFFDIPTAEFMVVTFFDTLKEALPADTKLESVKLWETQNSFAEYKGEEE